MIQFTYILTTKQCNILDYFGGFKLGRARKDCLQTSDSQPPPGIRGSHEYIVFPSFNQLLAITSICFIIYKLCI